MATHIGDELIERRSSILRAGDALVDVLDGVPPSCGDIAAQLDQLVLGGLIVRAHARIDGDLHLVLRRVALWGARLFVFDAFKAMPFFSSHTRNARSSWTESGTPSRSFTRRRPAMM